LSELCKKLEDIGRGGNTEGADVILSQVKAEYERVETTLRKEQDLRNGTIYSSNILKIIIFTPYIAVLRKS
jgi:hypothetical protein